jgi:hypothetical protein
MISAVPSTIILYKAPCATAGRTPARRASSGRPMVPLPGSAAWTAATSSRNPSCSSSKRRTSTSAHRS